ncbi:MAG TPA: lipid A-modifier LpxR family protein [Cyclobacteriaceae bacterium]
MKAFLLFLLLFYLGLSGKCQDRDREVLRNQLTFWSDNNFFLLNGDDGYYTSGLFFKYDRLSNKPTTALKKIFSYEVGQMIYNAHSRKILPVSQSNFPGGIEQIDRPIAGYLYGKMARSIFYRNNSMIKFGAFAGSTGKYSYAKEVQEFWHRVIGVKDYWNWVWDYQVKNEWSVNVQGIFAKALINKQSDFFQITPVTQATLGTAFTNVSQAVLFQFGRLRPINSSSYWNSRLQLTASGHHPIELFLFYQPTITYQVYNATIQGGVFRTDKGPVLSEVKPFVVSHEVGIRFSGPRYCFGYHLTFQTKECTTQFHSQSFASILGAFRF